MGASLVAPSFPYVLFPKTSLFVLTPVHYSQVYLTRDQFSLFLLGLLLALLQFPSSAQNLHDGSVHVRYS